MAKGLTSEMKIWIKHFFFPIARGAGSDYVCLYDRRFGESSADDKYIEAVDLIYDTITNQRFDTARDVDAAASLLAEDLTFSNVVEGEKNEGKKIKFSAAADLLKAIALMCAACEPKLEWSNEAMTPDELKEFEKTGFGRAIRDYDCYYSGEAKASVDPRTLRTRANTAAGEGHREFAKNKYRTFGARTPADTLRGLIDPAGEKQTAAGKYVWRIRCYYPLNHKTNQHEYTKKVFRVFIRPLKTSKLGVSEIGRDNKVFVGLENNYGDATCWFDTREAALEMLNKAKLYYNEGRLQLESDNADPDGYYGINTDLGEVLVEAYDLTEDIDTTIEDADELQESTIVTEAEEKERKYLLKKEHEAFMRD